MSNLETETKMVIQAAKEVGFDACGIAVASRLDEDAEWMESWIQKGLHGEMQYLERNREKRYDIRELVPGAKSVIVCLLAYDKCGHDYHRTIKSKLYELEARLGFSPLPTQHIFCDSAPVLERRWAEKAGLGFIGKNHQFFHPTLGSLVHIGELVTDQNLVPTEKIQAGASCEGCSLCIQACPNQALGREEWDATKCVAYITHKCEICQRVCPINKQ